MDKITVRGAGIMGLMCAWFLTQRGASVQVIDPNGVGAGASGAKASTSKAKAAPAGQPEMLSGPRAGGADDLKLLKGVGPKLETTLNELGVYHFDQVAAWKKKDIAWVDDRLKFKGRIERDDWVSQAKVLAKGGETEFSKRSKK